MSKRTNGNINCRIDAIDGLRGGSAIAIACIYHLATMEFYFPEGLPFNGISFMDWIYRRGGVLVEMFLAISGYVSFRAYTRKIDDGLTFWQYVIRRVIRIYPLMWATLGTSVLGHMIYYLQHSHTWWRKCDMTITTLIFNVLGLQAFYPGGQSWNQPAWSLSVFFICWLIYYAVIKFSKRQNAVRIAGCVVFILIGIGLQKNPLERDSFT